MTIVEFLEVRIAEDEAAANDLMGEREGDRTLAECAAKRAIIQSYESFRKVSKGANSLDTKLTASGIKEGLRIALASLSSIYNDHPDYKDEWSL